MRGFHEESPEVAAFRALVRAAEDRVGSRLVLTSMIDLSASDERLKRAAMAYAATQDTTRPKRATPKRSKT